jgi:DNA-directed RNA polymerase specialized sigma24 family protein
MRQRLKEYDRAGLAPHAIAARLKVPAGKVRSQLARLRRQREAAKAPPEGNEKGVPNG